MSTHPIIRAENLLINASVENAIEFSTILDNLSWEDLYSLLIFSHGALSAAHIRIKLGSK